MTGRGFERALAMPAAALVLVTGVLGVQVAEGGGRFEPRHPADPCAARVVSSQDGGIDGLTERLVLLGLDGAACRLHVSREALTLQLARSASSGGATDAEVEALHAGLLGAVRRMSDEGTLPPPSTLVDEALDSADLNGFVEGAIRALPDAVVDASLDTADVLTRTVDGLDVRALLGSLDDEQGLQAQVDAAVRQAVVDALVARLRGLMAGSL